LASTENEKKKQTKVAK